MSRFFILLLILFFTATACAEVPGPILEGEPQTQPLETLPPPSPVEVVDPALDFFSFTFPTHVSTSEANVVGPFSSRRLFKVSSAEGHTASDRADKIRNRIRSVAQSQDREVSLVGMTRYSRNAITLTANDRVLVTVTHADLDLIDAHTLPSETLLQMQMEVAEIWQRELQRELHFAAYIKTPAYLKLAIPLAILVTLLAAFLHYHVRKAKLLRLGSTIWGIEFVIWSGVAVFNLWLFPLTKTFAQNINRSFASPFFRIWFIILFGSILSNILEMAIYRYFNLLLAEPSVRRRQAQRLKTFSSVACRTVRWILMVVILFTIIATLPFDPKPFLTGAGVIGIAIGLAAQDLLKDIFAGVGILIEDRFGVGDWIEWDKYVGAVEMVNLQYTQIRTTQGGLVHIPNSDLRVVNNLTNEWAQVDFRVTITYQSDVDRAIKVLEEVARQLCEDMKESILGGPDSKGVHELGRHGVTLRLYIRTQPIHQWDVERELNRRIKLRFEKEKIEISLANSVVWVRDESSSQK